MELLVGWNNSPEAETLGLCLNVEETDATITTDKESFLQAVEERAFDSILLALDFPDEDTSFEVFQRARQTQPHAPIVAACFPEKLLQLPRFIKHGLSSYVPRDSNGEYIFLLTALIESAYHAAEAERAKQLASKLQLEISSVRKLQESVIPRDLCAPEGYEIVARYEQAQIHILGEKPVTMAGGDYYDVFRVDDESMVLLVGDASGHGMRACMSIMTMHTLIHMIRDESYQDTSDFVAAVNARLCNNHIVQGEGGFITLLYCILNPKTHHLQWTSAGHPKPLVHNLETNEVTTFGGKDTGGPPLGVVEHLPYDVCTDEIPKGCRVLLYTDGLEEAMPAEEDVEHEEFGIEGIKRTLQAARDLSLNDTLELLFAESSKFTQGSGRHDDTSIVLVERKA